MSEITISPTPSPITVIADTDPVEVHISNDPVSVSMSDTPIEFPQVVEAHSQLEEDALFLAGAKIVIRTDLI